MADNKITIIGLGLIGGSLAKAFNERVEAVDITAVDKDAKAISQAMAEGNISRGFTEFNEYVWDSDIVFICTPVRNILEFVNTISKNAKSGCIITDVGSTKSDIIKNINRMNNPPCFIGGHPMSGMEKTGYAASVPHLFENVYYVLTPCKSTTEYSLDRMTGLIKSIGALPIVLDADEHDRITGGISHVPHIIASALVNMIRKLDTSEGKMQMLAAGGFKDITRIASSSPEMWENVILSNKEQIAGILNFYINMLCEFKEFMKNNDSNNIYKFFESARDYRNTFSSGRTGLISPLYEIAVDVVDKPGIIGKIATILGDNEVNIKNINVSNSREFEQGCLRITLSDRESMDIAFDLLVIKGYKVYKNV